MHELDLRSIEVNHRQSPLALANNGNRRLDAADNILPEAFKKTVRIHVYMPAGSENVTLRAYGEYLTSLLQGQTTYRQATAKDHISSINQAENSCDLLIFGEPEQSAIERFLFGPVGRRVARKTSTTILVARQPHWPIRKILLVIRVEETEELAVDWAGRLTRFSDAQLTILPLVPSQPLIYGSGSRLQVGIASLLTPNTPSGKQLRRFLSQLRKWQVNGTLRVRQGDPLWQICWEIDEGKYDLVIIGADQCSRWRRWLFGELVGPLMCRVNRPLLIAGMRQPTALHPDQEQNDKQGVI